ncbi:hypothetical protein BJX64DRAFT_265852 [Aspergillus heterothallicus]
MVRLPVILLLQSLSVFAYTNDTVTPSPTTTTATCQPSPGGPEIHQTQGMLVNDGCGGTITVDLPDVATETNNANLLYRTNDVLGLLFLGFAASTFSVLV